MGVEIFQMLLLPKIENKRKVILINKILINKSGNFEFLLANSETIELKFVNWTSRIKPHAFNRSQNVYLLHKKYIYIYRDHIKNKLTQVKWLICNRKI